MELISITEENGQTFALFEEVRTEKKPVSREQLEAEDNNLAAEEEKQLEVQLKATARLEEIRAKREIIGSFLNPQATEESSEDSEESTDEESENTEESTE